MADKLLDKVKEYAAELEAAGRSPGYAYATAWARACKYHGELDEQAHCRRPGREYLTRKTNRRILGHLHRRCKGLPHGGELMYWAAMARGVRTRAVSLHGHVVLVYQREAFAPDLDDAAAVDEVLRRGTPLDAAHPPAYLEAQLEQLAAPERNPAPLIFYHGAQRWEGPPQIVAHRKGHAEHGPGIYLTTSWTTASKYAKGGGSVYRVEVSPLVRWLEDADLPLQETVDWVKALPRLRGKSDIMASLQRIASRVGKLPAEVLVNNFVNADAASGEHGPALADYLVRHGVDASHVRHGAEDWVVIFNPQTVLSVDRIASKDMDKGFSFDLPRVQRNPARRRRPRAPSTEGL